MRVRRHGRRVWVKRIIAFEFNQFFFLFKYTQPNSLTDNLASSHCLELRENFLYARLHLIGEK